MDWMEYRELLDEAMARYDDQHERYAAEIASMAHEGRDEAQYYDGSESRLAECCPDLFLWRRAAAADEIPF